LSGESKCWIAQNLGADRQAVASDDFSESSAGWYWQFNRKQGYSHDGIFTRTPNSAWITNINEDLNWIPSNDPCNLLLGSGWRIPLLLEWQRVNVNGSFFVGNQYNFFTSTIRLHASGFFHPNDGTLQSRGVDGFFWSSNQGSISDTYPYSLYTHSSGGAGVTIKTKSHGLSVRCIKD
jgi:uncharacterized protein (TIGR02145 family)